MANFNREKTTDDLNTSAYFKKFLWIEKNFLYCMGLVLVIWLVGIGYYVNNFVGWSFVKTMNPKDFCVLFIVSLFPLFMGWFIIAYIARTAGLNANARLFQKYIDSLLYPDDSASKNARNIASVLQEQIKSLQNENKKVIEQSLNVRKDLDLRVSELASILQLLDTYSAKTLIELNDGVKNLSDKCGYITDKATNTVIHLKECSSDISENSERFISKINPVLDEISAISSNIKNNIVENKVGLAEIKGQLENCAIISQKHIDELLAKTNENTQRIGKSFYKTAEECEALYRRLDMGISGVEGKVEEQKRLIESQSKVLEHNSELLNNKLSKYGQTVTAEIDKLVKNSIELENLTKRQIQTLKAVNNETGKAIQGIGYTFDEKRAEIERRSEYAINSMQNVILAINKETEKLVNFTNLTQAKNADLQNIAETIVDRVGDISGKLALKTDALKDKAVEVIDKFTQASDIIAQSTEKINNSSHIMINNSKHSLSLWEEQKGYIDNAINNIDIVSEKLSNLKNGVRDTTIEIDNILSGYAQQIKTYSEKSDEVIKVEQQERQIDKASLVKMSSIINKTLAEKNILIDSYFAGIDMFDLWDEYLSGNINIFSEKIKHSLLRKNLMTIMKIFENNTEFHSTVMKFLPAMDGVIKEINFPKQMTRNEILNFTVSSSLDKIYFTLIKALNSAE